MKTFIIIAFIIACATRCDAQAVDTLSIDGYLDKLRAVGRGMDSGEWQNASLEWEKIVSLNPADGSFWFKLGSAYENTGQTGKAVAAFKKAYDTGAPPPADCAYAIAQCYARANNRALTMVW